MKQINSFLTLYDWQYISHNELNCNHVNDDITENDHGEEYMVCTKR